MIPRLQAQWARVPEEARRLAVVALALALLVVWMHRPAFDADAIVGAAGTDTLRAAWGFDHTARSLPFAPWWTNRVGFPAGVKLLVLPTVSTLLGAPLRVFGPILGYNLWVLGMLWASGVATAWLALRASGSAAGGLIAGVAMVLQPITLVALSDGTVEHVAVWALPASIAAFWGLRRAGDGAGDDGADAKRRRDLAAVAAGVLTTICALDSPYNAVFCLPFLAIAAPRVPLRALVVYAAVCAVGLAVVAVAYVGLPVTASDDRRAENAIRVDAWLQWERGRERPWDFTFSPTFVPIAGVLGALVFTVGRPLRALPWVAVALACLVFGLGPGDENPKVLGTLAGDAGRSIGESLAWFNQTFPTPVVRFPRRWLTPFALALAVAAAIGLSRVPWRVARGVMGLAAALAYVVVSVRLLRIDEAYPRHAPARPAFAAWVQQDRAWGATLSLPRIRASSVVSQRREDLPVFASLGDTLRSSDMVWLQVLYGRAAVSAPVGLRTMVPKAVTNPEIATLLRDLDDLSKPRTSGEPIPPSATQEPDRRAKAARALVERGLAFVILDEAAYAGEAQALARLPFADMIEEERHFDDGSGVTVWKLDAR